MSTDLEMLGEILSELRATRADQRTLIADHDARIAALEKKHDRRSAVISAVTAVAVAIAAAIAR